MKVWPSLRRYELITIMPLDELEPPSGKRPGYVVRLTMVELSDFGNAGEFRRPRDRATIEFS